MVRVAREQKKTTLIAWIRSHGIPTKVDQLIWSNWIAKDTKKCSPAGERGSSSDRRGFQRRKSGQNPGFTGSPALPEQGREIGDEKDAFVRRKIPPNLE